MGNMIKCYVKTFFLLLVLAGCYLLSFLPLWLIYPSLQVDQFVIAALLWFLLALLSLPFFLNHLIKTIWFFKGDGQSVQQEEIEAALLAINSHNLPFAARKKQKKIIITWRCKDPEWSERMAIEGIKKSYVLRLIINEQTRTVKMVDGIQYVNFDLCPVKVKTSWLIRPRFYTCVRRKKTNTLDNLQNTPPDKFTFKPREIKEPVFNTILSQGWNIIFAIF